MAMTILEKKSLRKKKSILSLVNKGEYSAGYALMLVEELNDTGKLTEADYEELAEYLESLLDEENNIIEEPVEEPTEEVEEVEAE
jgi:polyhydroxyalkanoate synthesis regulator phasin